MQLFSVAGCFDITMRILIVSRDITIIEPLNIFIQEYVPDKVEIVQISALSVIKTKWKLTFNFDLIFVDLDKANLDYIKKEQTLKLAVPVVVIKDAVVELPNHFFSIYKIDKPLTSAELVRALLKFERIKPHYSELVKVQDWPGPAVGRKLFKSRFLIKLGSRMIFINTNDIACFFVSDKTVYVLNKEGIKYPIDFSLEKLQQLLDPQQFFRINRYMICSAGAIKEIKKYINSRLKIILTAGNYSDEALVSRERVYAFKKWVEN